MNNTSTNGTPNSNWEMSASDSSELFLGMLTSFVKERGLIRFQIDSYDDFITRRIPKILREIKEIKPEVPEIGDFKIKLGDFRIGKENWGPWIKEADGSERRIMPMEAYGSLAGRKEPYRMRSAPHLRTSHVMKSWPMRLELSTRTLRQASRRPERSRLW